jgi:hypothetical protein
MSNRSPVILLIFTYGIVGILIYCARFDWFPKDPYCINCQSDDQIYIAKTTGWQAGNNVNYDGKVLRWLCAKCGRQWEALPLDLHRQRNNGCVMYATY